MEEWNHIVDTIRSAGLSPIFPESRVWRDIPYLWANHIYEPSGKCFAKYLFTYITAAQWQQWPQWDDDFVSDIIEPAYFQQTDDTCWNIYWVSVMPESQFAKMDIQQRIIFSSNTEYTRNFIVPMEHLADMIPVGHIRAQPGSKGLQDPVEDWFQKLEPEGLDFCLREFSQRAFDAYLNGVTQRRNILRKPSDAVSAKRLNALKSILIPRDFRPHYYSKEWTIPFQAVNLLYGANGSGKTSLLSAIELAITGDVRGPFATAGSNCPASSNVVLTAETNSNVMVLCPPREAKEKKRLEEELYQGRTTKRPAPQLQNLFHQFNYLSADETFLFVGQQPDLSNIFSKILFGPETSDMWRNCNRHLEECGKNISNLNQLLDQLHKLDAEVPDASPANETAFRAYITASGLALDPDETPDSILFRVETVLAEYDKVKDLAPILPPKALQKDYKEQRAQYTAQAEQFGEQQEALKGLDAAIEQMESQIGSLRDTVQRESAVLKVLREAEPLCKQFSFYIAALDAVEYYRTTTTQAERCTAKLKQLMGFSDQYSAVLQAPLLNSLEDIKAEMRVLHNKDDELKRELAQLEDQIEQAKTLQEQHGQLLTALHSIGRRLYQMEQQRTTCPLCGTDGITRDILLSHLEETSTEGSRQLQGLYDGADRLKNERGDIGCRLKQLGQEQIAAQGRRLALQTIQEHFPQIQTFTDLQQELESAQSKASAIAGQLAEIKGFLQAELQASGLNAGISDVLSSREKLQEQLMAAKIAFPAEASDDEFAQWLNSTREQKTKTLKEQAEELQKSENALRQLSGQRESCSEGMEQLRQKLARMKADLHRLTQLQSFWNRVESITVNRSLSGEALRTVCASIATQARSLMEYTEFQKTKENYRTRMEQAKQKWKRCQLLKERLKGLSSPETYAERFIQENIDQIGQIFLALHSPQEFSGLAHSKDGELTALRNGENVPISLMSTGQRTALVISVFFQMNLATPYAPKFLLLDEPVANIDDLNVLALMDFLRELVITHKRQIFFTTANRNVARLFRRKFSFLLQDFQELRFLRAKEQNLEITRYTYDQSKALEPVGL